MHKWTIKEDKEKKKKKVKQKIYEYSFMLLISNSHTNIYEEKKELIIWKLSYDKLWYIYIYFVLYCLIKNKQNVSLLNFLSEDDYVAIVCVCSFFGFSRTIEVKERKKEKENEFMEDKHSVWMFQSVAGWSNISWLHTWKIG